MTFLEKSILATIVYYDVLDRPLTNWEIFNYLIKTKDYNYDLNKVLKVLEKSPELAKLINQKNGFYFLKPRRGIIKQRIRRQIIADQKWRKAQRFIKLLQMVPFVRLVALSGSLAMNNTEEDSDIDLLIVAKSGKIWTTRILVTGLIHLTGWRKRGEINQTGICLNHYLADDSLKIGFDSLYNAQSYAHLIPLIDQGNVYQKFQLKNQWIKKYLVFYPQQKKGNLKKIKFSPVLKNIAERCEFLLNFSFGSWTEKRLKKWQTSHIIQTDRNNKERIKKLGKTPAPGRIVVNDHQLEFHPDSSEKNILEKYNKKMQELGLSELGKEQDSGLV